ncbi:autotransporter outer membrane beta-barrel domain-containing protein [Mesorhizobium sp. Z1-4]|uniref:autotransporter outer membrane beta-barrel domain-containing protein n=1 Tax=Mesorhizobium sp. Z1-4 TaxID=2448478 RepID=UPI000FD977AB|nr:autotransporter outer membrane beta-barrel domain-containing protein [Mesorhizobium sp. Z1-4]
MRIRGLPATVQMLFAGLFLVLSSVVFSVAPAHAISASCTALKGMTFSYTGGTPLTNPFDMNLNGGAVYTLNAGEKISFNVTVPAGSIVTISFAGESVTVDNTAGGTPLNQTVTITVPNTGPTASGTIRFQGHVTGTNTLSVSIDCTDAAAASSSNVNAQQKAGVVDNAIRGVVPGANLLDDFGVPDFGFNPLGIPNVPCGLLIASLNEDLRRALAEIAALDGDFRTAQTGRDDHNRMIRLGRSMKEVVSDLADCLVRFGNGNAVGAALGGGTSCAAEQAAVLRAQMGLARDMADHLIAVTKLQIAVRLAESARFGALLADDRFGDAKRAARSADRDDAIFRIATRNFSRTNPIDRAFLEKLAAEAESDAAEAAIEPAAAEVTRTQARVNASQALLNRAEAALAACQAQNGAGFFPVHNSTVPPAVAATARLAAAHAPAQAPGMPGALGYQPGLPVAMAASDNSFSFAYDLASMRLKMQRAYGAAGAPDGILGDPRFNMWVNGSVTFHIDPTGLAQRGTTAAVAAGASYRLTPWINAGVAARYAHSNRFGTTGNATASAWSVAAFAQARIAGQLLLETIVAYSGATANATFASGATGTAVGRSLAGQAKLSRSFALGGWTATPALGISVVNVQRDAFTASDGTVVAASNTTQTTLTFGPSFQPSRGFAVGNSGATVTPSFGLDFFANLGRFDPIIGAGGTTVASSDSFGVAARAGLAVAFAGGASASVNTSYAGIGGTSQSISIAGNLRIPIGGR